MTALLIECLTPTARYYSIENRGSTQFLENLTWSASIFQCEKRINECSRFFFEKLDYVSMFIHATTGVPRILFAVSYDKSMEANFGNATIDFFVVHDLRVMYRKAVTILYLYSYVAWFYYRGGGNKRKL